MTETVDIKSRIWQKAHELFMQYGIRSVSMDELAASLGMSKKTIYQHFKDKHAVVGEAIKNVIESSRHCTTFDRAGSRNAIDEAMMSVDAFEEVFNSMNPSLVFDLQKYHPAVYEQFAKYKNDFIYENVKANILRGIEEGLYREDIDVEVLSRLRVESIWVPFTSEYYMKVKTPLPQVQKELFYHFLYGIVSEKGYKLLTKYKKDRLNNTKKNDKRKK